MDATSGPIRLCNAGAQFLVTRASNMASESQLTIIPGDDGGNDTKGLIMHTARLVAKGQVRAALLRPQGSFSIVDQPFEFAASRNYFSKGSIDHCARCVSKDDTQRYHGLAYLFCQCRDMLLLHIPPVP